MKEGELLCQGSFYVVEDLDLDMGTEKRGRGRLGEGEVQGRCLFWVVFEEEWGFLVAVSLEKGVFWSFERDWGDLGLLGLVMFCWVWVR